MYCRSSGATELTFNLHELMEPTETQACKTKSPKAGRQFDSGLGVGDTVTVVTSKKTGSENEVHASTCSF